MTQTAIDPVLASALERQLQLVAREMGLSLLRTTRSPVFHQARDFATGLFDHQGHLLQQAEYLPLLSLALKPACIDVIERFRGETEEGDVFIHNDVFAGGNQLSDVGVFKPVFVSGLLIGWAACKGHQADIGGAVRGGVNPAAAEVWEEGIRIPAVKIIDRGRRRDDVWDLLMKNVRLPTVAYDLLAQIGSCAVGERGLHSIVERYGKEAYERHVTFLLDAVERRTRRFISTIPDGLYSGESEKRFSDESLIGRNSLRVRTSIRVHGEEIEFDFSGTDAQTESYVNAPLATSTSAVLLAFRMLVGRELNLNDGMLRPIHVHVPEGTVLNPEYPAATAYGNHLTDQIAEAIFSAMAKALPSRVSAGWNRLFGSYISGWDHRSNLEYHDVLFLANKGGSGAVEGANGYDHIGTIEGCGVIRSADYEMFEMQNPVLIRHHEYAVDSAGVGRWRGGFGVHTRLEFLASRSEAVFYGDGLMAGAYGLFGGGRGSLNRAVLHRKDGTKRLVLSDDVVRPIGVGDVLEKEAGGGGGYGDPRERPADEVILEIRGGLVSPEAAANIYGVVIDPGGGGFIRRVPE